MNERAMAMIVAGNGRCDITSSYLLLVRDELNEPRSNAQQLAL
jgi:hypothetical protein